MSPEDPRESSASENAPRPQCAKCHLPIREGEASIIHGSAHYHSRCAPDPWTAGEKDDPYEPGPIAI